MSSRAAGNHLLALSWTGRKSISRRAQLELGARKARPESARHERPTLVARTGPPSITHLAGPDWLGRTKCTGHLLPRPSPARSFLIRRRVDPPTSSSRRRAQLMSLPLRTLRRRVASPLFLAQTFVKRAAVSSAIGAAAKVFNLPPFPSDQRPNKRAARSRFRALEALSSARRLPATCSSGPQPPPSRPETSAESSRKPSATCRSQIGNQQVAEEHSETDAEISALVGFPLPGDLLRAPKRWSCHLATTATCRNDRLLSRQPAPFKRRSLSLELDTSEAANLHPSRQAPKRR